MFIPHAQAMHAHWQKRDLVVFNGLLFEGWMERLIESSDYNDALITATDGIRTRFHMKNAMNHGHDHDHGHGITMITDMTRRMVIRPSRLAGSTPAEDLRYQYGDGLIEADKDADEYQANAITT